MKAIGPANLFSTPRARRLRAARGAAHERNCQFLADQCLSYIFAIYLRMDDDDGPPMLVDSNGVEDEDANLNAETEDVKPTKVPISIITG